MLHWIIKMFRGNKQNVGFCEWWCKKKKKKKMLDYFGLIETFRSYNETV